MPQPAKLHSAGLSKEQSVVLFDGVCNLCNGAVDFILRRDRRQRFVFASLQSAAGQRLLRQHQLPTKQYESMVLIHRGKLYQRSMAALQIARELSGGWSLLYYLKVVPAFLRDGIYNFIARNRYKFFGKNNSCRLPLPEEAARFLG